jgi:hypothetical protein
MSFSMSQASLPTFEIGLNALSAILDKAEAFAAAKKIDPAVLLNARLAPDMFPLVRQVQVASDLVKNGAARLAGVEPPRYEDKETTIAELKARLAKTVAFVKSLDRSKWTRRPVVRSRFPLARPTKGRCKATTTSTTSCCRTYISTSPPPTRSCVIAAWRSESRISSVRFP